MLIDFKVDYFISVFPRLIKALPITLSISVIGMLLGIILGTLITFARRSKNRYLNGVFNTYVSFFRGTPLMVQMFLFFFGMPQIMPSFARVPAYGAAILVMTINSSAYISEVVRSSLLAVDKGQMEAALAMGMSRFRAMERIILPQAFKIAIAPLGNTFISMIQGTAIVFMIGLRDIMGISKMTAAASYRFFETYLAVGIIYWVITLVVTKLIDLLEGNLTYEK
ncbi:MAG: amino acid ABC transporter permease [Acidaminobacteraceae bacterium]